MKKLLTLLALFYLITNSYSQMEVNKYMGMDLGLIKLDLEMKNTEDLITISELLLDFMVQEIEESINSNSIDISVGVNEISYLKQSQVFWKNYIENFTSYIASSYLGGSIINTIWENELKNHYMRRNLELIENHKRWKMDQ